MYITSPLFRATAAVASVLLLGPTGLSAQESSRSHPSGEPDILQGVHRLHFPGLPGDLLALDDNVRVLVAGETRSGTRSPVALAREWRKGRALLFSHALFTKKSREQFDGERFLRNCLLWVGRSAKPSVALSARDRELVGHMAALGCQVVPLKRGRLPKQGEARVWILNMSAFDSGESARAAIRKHVAAGGGVIAYGPGWGWKQTHRGKSLGKDNGVNLVLGEMGMMLGQGMVRLESTKAKKRKRGRKKRAASPTQALAPGFPVRQLVSAAFQLPGALETLEDAKSPAADRKQAAATLVTILSALSLDHERLRPLRSRLKALEGGRRRPHALRVAKTLELKGDLLRSTKGLSAGESLGLPVPDFPGPCAAPDEPRVHEVTVGMGQGGWASTGLYVPPGRIVVVEWVGASVPRGDISSKSGKARAGDAAFLQIGCHKDRLWHKDKWKRDPQITRSFELGVRTRIWSRHGGLLYLVSKRPVEKRLLRITGCVEAPRYVLGKDSAESWKRSRALAAPWGELEGKRIIFSLPTSVLATVEDPAPILEFWDSVVDSYEQLDPQPARPRKQRVVSDRQISAGYMHAGYPIMTWMDAPPKIVDLGWVHDRKGGGPWGLFHEIGHNYQQRAWTFGGTGEVTNNVFVLYGYEQLLGRKSLDTAMRRKMPQRAKAHLAAEAPFDRWKSSPFLALEMYRQLSVEFGWSAFQKCFQSYRDQPLPRRASDQRKRDEWMLRFSRATQRDLGPFFERWGIPVSASARKQLATLDPWSGAK